MNLVAVGCIALCLFSDIEVQKEFLRDGLSDLIAREWNHAISDDRTVLRYGDIRGTCTDINEYEVEMAHRRRYQHVYSSYRL